MKTINETVTTKSSVRISFYKDTILWMPGQPKTYKVEFVAEAADFYEAFAIALEKGANPDQTIKYEWL